MAASTADTVPPVADTCEAMQVPCVTNDCPWQAYFFGRGGDPAVGFEWTYHSWWGLEGITATFVDMWDSLKTNKKVAEMWPNDGDGLAWANEKTGQPPVLKAGGYTIIDGGRYQDLTDDYSAQIGKFKAADAQILSGVMLPPDFTNFWKQSLQQGFNPNIATVGKALLFPQSLEALGDIGYNLSSECWWSPNHPFKSSLTGQTCKELADQYETDNNAAVDAADPPLRHLRGRRRRAEAHHQRGRQGEHPRRHRRHRHGDHRRPRHVEQQRQEAQPGAQRLHHADHRRPVGQGRPSTRTT